MYVVKIQADVVVPQFQHGKKLTAAQGVEVVECFFGPRIVGTHFSGCLLHMVVEHGTEIVEADIVELVTLNQFGQKGIVRNQFSARLQQP